MSRQAATLRVSGDVGGEEGLIAAVIVRAVKDALGSDAQHRASARRYFLSDVYDLHLAVLGLESDTVPVAFTQKENS